MKKWTDFSESSSEDHLGLEHNEFMVVMAARRPVRQPNPGAEMHRGQDNVF
jgi:hypothetical protein